MRRLEGATERCQPADGFLPYGVNDAASRASARVDSGERAPGRLLDAPAKLRRDLVERRNVHERGRYRAGLLAARSMTRAAARTVVSVHFLPMSCTAIGNRPSKPVGRVAAGAPVRLAGSRNT